VVKISSLEQKSLSAHHILKEKYAASVLISSVEGYILLHKQKLIVADYFLLITLHSLAFNLIGSKNS
jgi:hypothetical protein